MITLHRTDLKPGVPSKYVVQSSRLNQPMVINAVRDEIGLSEAQFQATRDVLAEYGKMSPPTAFFVLQKILDTGIAPGDWCVIVAFGVRLCAHVFLLRV